MWRALVFLVASGGVAGGAWARGPATDAPACATGPELCVAYAHPNHAGCGTRRGPGCRKANGQCAGWGDRVVPSCAALPRPGAGGR